MNRREFISLLGGGAAATWPLTLHAQHGDIKRGIGVLMGAAPTKLGETYLAAFFSRLEELGWKKDRNAHIEVRWWIGGAGQMGALFGGTLPGLPRGLIVF